MGSLPGLEAMRQKKEPVYEEFDCGQCGIPVKRIKQSRILLGKSLKFCSLQCSRISNSKRYGALYR